MLNTGSLLCACAGAFFGIVRTVAAQEFREAATLKGHKDGDFISSIGFTRDSKCLVSGSSDALLIIWDLATFKEKGRISGHTDKIMCVDIHPAGKILASSARDRTLRFWDLDSRTEVFNLKASEAIDKFGYSNSGKLIAFNRSPHATIYDVDSKKETKSFLRVDAGVGSVAFTADDRYLAVGRAYYRPNGAGFMILHDLMGKQDDVMLEGHVGQIECIAFSRDGRLMASGGRDQTVVVWDLKTHKKKHVLTGFKDRLSAVAFSPNSKLLATGCWGKPGVRVWDMATGKEIPLPNTEGNDVRSVAFSPDGKWLAAGYWDKTQTKVWEVVDSQTAPKE